MQKVYFDNAATTPLRPEVIEKMTTVLREDYGNPSSTHGFGRSAKNHLEQARKNIASYLGVTAAEITFTSGGTEADNLVLNSAVRDLSVTHIITSKVEHHAVLHTLQELERKTALQLSYVAVQNNGAIDYTHLETLLDTATDKTLVSLMHVNNEIGTILDIDRVGMLCRQYDALFHSDMVQSIGHLPIDLGKTAVDFAAASAHKFHGPKGVGFAYIKKSSGIQPLIYGGQQERGYRGGTEGVHNIVGMEEALRIAYENMENEKTHIAQLKSYFITQIQKKLPIVSFNADCTVATHCTYTLLNVSIPMPSDKAGILLFQLDIHGIACSKGSACQSGSHQGSHVLAEILDMEALSNPSIRFSFSAFNTIEEVEYVVDTLGTLIG